MKQILAFIAVCFAIGCSGTSEAKAAYQANPPVAAPAPEPDEPCTVEAKSDLAREAASHWCGDGLDLYCAASDVHKTERMCNSNKFALLNRFRLITDDIVKDSHINVAFSLHHPNGELAGGCYPKRTEKESTCTKAPCQL